MQVKTFEALTIKDCLKSVKNEFGNDAVILNTRKKAMGDNGSMVFEVTAARSERSGASKENALVSIQHQDRYLQGSVSEFKDKSVAAA